MDEDLSRQFVRLYTSNQTEIHRYILALVVDRDDAQEVLQETALDLWKKMGQYDPSQPFINWACRFALNQVWKLRRRQGRASKLLSCEMLERLAAEHAAEAADVQQGRQQALVLCLEGLSQSDRTLLQQRYGDAKSVKQAAAERGVGVDLLYSRLKRLRAALLECVQRRLAAEVADG